MRYGVAVLTGFAALLAGAAIAQPTQQTARPVIVCGNKAGAWQSYWNEEAAIRDGAILIRQGGCPSKQSYE